MSYFAELPEEICVGGQVVSVQELDQDDPHDYAHIMVGESDEVQVSPKLTRWMTWWCFWHELVHWFYLQNGETHLMEDCEEEKRCDQIASKLAELCITGQLAFTSKQSRQGKTS